MYIRSERLPSGPVLLLLLLHLVAIPGGASSWDLAVTVGNKIDFITRNGSIIDKTIIANASSLVGLAYDEDSRTMFLSDAKNRDLWIFSVNLSETNVTVTPILARNASEPPVLDMALDRRAHTLYWTNGWAIMKMRVPMKKAPAKPDLVHKSEATSPRGVALDVCNRHIYWANGNHSSPSIMRSNFDGSELRIVVRENLYEPTSVAVDPINGKLYWIDDEEGIHYKLEQSNLDGSERLALIHGKHQQPIDLTVDSRSFYWTDFVYNAIWELGKEKKSGVEPTNLRSYYDPNNPDDIRNILVRDSFGSATDDCNAVKANSQKRTNVASASTLVVQPIVKIISNLTANDSAERCLNGGELQSSDGSCRCKSGYGGSRCEISSCHNYCVRGECYVDNKGMPVCKCSAPHSGSRCEYDVCNGFCLNDGRCLVDKHGKPSCECKYVSGVRCEVTFDMAEICALYCINRQLQITSIDTTSCRCAELNQTIEEVLDYDAFNCTILVSLLSGFIGMLTIIIVFLSVYVSKLRRRPRIKKRFVVNKSGITPLTSRPSQMSGDQCEITIENCCNMNICETPCFEPKLRSSNARTSGVKKEEKNGLLDHMECGGNLC
ncbi:PREDICTED: protein cueball [Ceratosolen solmsi marchali]|uniref:Protein cueball n=1 Tax=Ceratosolen solmsi marchali TaxID=326594 RepID=A0AAJ7DXV0_9HYME|nr:PREDICTED: protein cueball [Ceratosolen solmsi marchali]